jgi:hypothetical protein
VAGGDMPAPRFTAGAVGRGEEFVPCFLFLPFLFFFFFFLLFLQLPLGVCWHCFFGPVVCGCGSAVAGGIAGLDGAGGAVCALAASVMQKIAKVKTDSARRIFAMPRPSWGAF